MAAPRVARKWRPPLALIVFAVLLSVMALPVSIVLWFRSGGDAAPGGPAELAALAAALVLTLIVAFVLTRTLTVPIRTLIARTGEIGRGGRDAIRPLDVYGTREIATLSQSFLSLAARLVDHADYMRTFASHVSHELKSPLTSIRGAAELLREDGAAMTEAQRARFLDNIVTDAERLDALLVSLRELAQAELAAAPAVTPLGEIVAALRQKHPELWIDAPADAAVRLSLSREAALMVLGNLAGNAAEHGARSLAIAAAVDGDALNLTVRDDGPGIAEAARSQVFLPFYTTRRAEGGTGMGLAIARAVLVANGGAIRLAEDDGEGDGVGAGFEITLPRAAMPTS